MKKAKQFNRAVQLFLQRGELDDSERMECADIYPLWKLTHEYKAGEIFRYGKNLKGKSQLYTVLQSHTSQENWQPDSNQSLYKAIGFNKDGTQIWTQPLGYTDAYQADDVVEHNQKQWKSTIDNNVWEPGIYGWVEYKEE